MKTKNTSWLNVVAVPIIVAGFAVSANADNCAPPTDTASIIRGCVNIAGSFNKMVPIYRSPDDGNWDCGAVGGDIAVQPNGDLKVTWDSSMKQDASIRAYFGNPSGTSPGSAGDGKCDSGGNRPQLNDISMFEKMDLADKSFTYTIDMSGLNNADASYYNVFMYLTTPSCCVNGGNDTCLDCLSNGAGSYNDRYYCDAGSSGAQCLEIDIMEANPVSFQSTIHGISLGSDGLWWPDHNGCAQWAGHFDVRGPVDVACAADQKSPNYGPNGANIDTNLPFKVTVSFPWDHANDSLAGMQMNLTQTGKPGIDMGCVQPKGPVSNNTRPQAGCWSCDQSINWEQISTAIKGISGGSHDQHMQMVVGMNGGYSPVGTACAATGGCSTGSATFSNFAITNAPEACTPLPTGGGNTVAGDLNNDGCIDVMDVLMIIDIFGTCP